MPRTNNPIYKEKVRRFAREFVNNGFNATEATRVTYPNVVKEEVLNTIGYENIRKHQFITAIDEELNRAGLTNEFLDNELHYIAKQKKHLPSKLASIVEANKLKKRYATSDDGTSKHLHLHLTNPNNMSEQLSKLQDELKQLRQAG